MIDSKILERYLAGRGTKQDRETIIDWFSSLSEESSLRKRSFPIWNNPDSRSLLLENRAESLLDRIHHRIRLQEKPVRKENKTILRYIRILSRVAAVLFIPLVIYLWTLRDYIYTAKSALVNSEIYCPPSTRTMFNLPDGSQGWLNGGSTLKFPVEFKGKTRTVNLTGEAFFDVKSDPKKPFLVEGDHIKVKAYGTSFNVMSYPEERINEVTLVEGSIEVLAKKNGTIQSLGTLDPGQICSYDRASSLYNISNADIEKHISWTSGKLVFKDDSFQDLVRKCNRWYNVNLVIKDKALTEYTYVGTFHDETLDEVLKFLCLTAPIEYKDLGRKRKDDGTFEKRKIELSFIKKK